MTEHDPRLVARVQAAIHRDLAKVDADLAVARIERRRRSQAADAAEAAEARAWERFENARVWRGRREMEWLNASACRQLVDNLLLQICGEVKRLERRREELASDYELRRRIAATERYVRPRVRS